MQQEIVMPENTQQGLMELNVPAVIRQVGFKRKGIAVPQKEKVLSDLRSNDAHHISWSRGLFQSFVRKTAIPHEFQMKKVMMRPFCKEWLFYNRKVIEMPSRWESIFPQDGMDNRVICVSGAPLKKPFSVLITDCIQDLNMLEHSQCFPMFYYEEDHGQEGQLSLFDALDEERSNATKYKKA